MNPTATPQQMLPPQAVASMVRQGGSPGQIFQQSPLTQQMTPGAMGADPSLMQQPPMGSQAQNPTMPSSPPMNQAGVQQPNGQPGAGDPQLSEAQYILNALNDRLKHHSKITEKTVNTLSDMIAAGTMPTLAQLQEADTGIPQAVEKQRTHEAIANVSGPI